MVLLSLLCRLREEVPFSLGLCHVAYGLRKEENHKEIELLKEFSLANGTPLFLQEVARKAPSDKRIQAWAREIRYDFFQSLAAEGWAIALAHHEDDAAENVVFRLARGSRPVGLLGMSAWKAPYWRPLLSMQKEELLAFAKAEALVYWEDSSNATVAYSRNRVRHQVLPALEGISAGAKRRIVSSAGDIRDLAAYVRQGFSDRGVSTWEALPLSFLRGLPKGVAKEAIEVWLQGKSLPLPRLSDAIYGELFIAIHPTKEARSWHLMLSLQHHLSIRGDALCLLDVLQHKGQL